MSVLGFVYDLRLQINYLQKNPFVCMLIRLFCEWNLLIFID